MLDPQDYSEAFNQDISALSGVTAANAQGMREAPGATYATESHEDNPDHILKHWCSDAVPPSPFAAANVLLADTWRGLQALVQYFDGHIFGWPALDSRYGSKTYTGPYTRKNYEIKEASGNALTLWCRTPEGSVLDPRSDEVWSGLSYDLTNPIGGVETVGESGAYVMPWCLVRFYNSLMNGRSQPMIIGFGADYGDLPDTVTTDDYFTVLLSQDVDYAATALNDEAPVFAQIVAQYETPSAQREIHDQYLTPVKTKLQVFTSADWGEGKVVELKDHDSNSCACSFPIRDRQNGWHILGTFKVEVSSDGAAYKDVTRQFDSGPGNYPRFKIAGKMPSVTTKVYLGPITGDSRDFTTGNTHIKITYKCPTSYEDGGAHCIEARCGNSRRDYMNFVGNIDSLTAKDVNSDQEHFFCGVHAEVPSENRSNYTWNCSQCGTCPKFKLLDLGRVDEVVCQQLVSNEPPKLRQSAPGKNTIMDWTWSFADAWTHSIYASLNDPREYESNYDNAYVARLQHMGGKCCWLDIEHPYIENPVYDGETIVGYDHSLKLVKGAIWNLNGDTTDAAWDGTRFTSEMTGILPRRMPSGLKRLDAMGDERSDDTDPCRQVTETPGRHGYTLYKDVRFGTALAFATRATAGLESENRAQRVRTGLVRYMSGVDLDAPGKYGPTNDDSVQVIDQTSPGEIKGVPIPVTYRDIENVIAVIKLWGEGRGTHGRKKMSTGGTNGSVWRAEDIGGGKLKIHCSPGLCLSSMIDSSGDEPTTKAYPWFASGNVVAFPPHYDPYQCLDNAVFAKLQGTLARKAVRGDSFVYKGRNYKIVKAEPGVGDDFSGGSGTTFVQPATLQPYVAFDEFFDPDTGLAPRIEITFFELQFTAPGGVPTDGTWYDYSDYVVSLANEMRPYAPAEDPATGFPYAYWDWTETIDATKFQPIYTIYQGGDGHTVIEFDEPPVIPGTTTHLKTGDQIYLKDTPGGLSNGNHTLTKYSATVYISNRDGLPSEGWGPAGEWIPILPGFFSMAGSGRIYFDQAIFAALQPGIGNAAALLLGYNNARVTVAVDGIEQTPREVVIWTPRVKAQAPVDLAKIRYAYAMHTSRIDGVTRQLAYAGESGYGYDAFVNENPFTFKYYKEGSDEYFLFSPLLSGDLIQIYYETTEPIRFDSRGEPGTYIRDFMVQGDHDEHKRCDVLTIENDNDELDPDTMTNQAFGVTSANHIDQITALAVRDVGDTGSYSTISTDNHVVFPGSGEIAIKAAAFTP